MASHEQLREFRSDELECVPVDEVKLGQGGFGTVVLAFHAIYNLLAIKCFRKVGGERKEKILEKQVKKELENLQKSNHENVVRVFGWVKNTNVFGIVTEYLPGESLMELVEDVELGSLLKLRICTEVANGLSFIHNFSEKNRLIHGDIKPDNILLTEDLHCKIGDFGSANISAYTGGFTITATGETLQTTNQFTEFYAAPELLRYPLMKPKASMDTYSYGMLVYVVLGPGMPVNSDAKLELFKQSIMNGHRPDLDDIIDMKRVLEENGEANGFRAMEALISAMEDCWKQEPSDRPSMLHVKERLYEVLAEIPSNKIHQNVIDAIQEMDVSKHTRKQHDCVPFHHLSLFHSFDFATLPQSSNVANQQTSQSMASDDQLPEALPKTKSMYARKFDKSRPLISGVAISEKSQAHDGTNTSASTSQSSSVAISQSPQPTASDEVIQLVRSIKSSLEGNDVARAVAQTMQLLSVDTTLRNTDIIVDDVIASASSLRDKSEYLTSLKLIGWASDICGNIDNPEVKFRKLYDCCVVVEDVSYSMCVADMKLYIEQYCLPLLNKSLEKLKPINIEDTKFKSERETWCLLCIGWSNHRIDKHELAIEIASSCLASVTSLYGDDTPKHRALSSCYELLADANHNKGDYESAVGYWKRNIEALRSAEDVSEDERKKWIEDAEEYLSRAQAKLSSRS